MFNNPSEYLEAGLSLPFGQDLKHLFNSAATVKTISKGTIVLSKEKSHPRCTIFIKEL